MRSFMHHVRQWHILYTYMGSCEEDDATCGLRKGDVYLSLWILNDINRLTDRPSDSGRFIGDIVPVYFKEQQQAFMHKQTLLSSTG